MNQAAKTTAVGMADPSRRASRTGLLVWRRGHDTPIWQAVSHVEVCGVPMIYTVQPAGGNDDADRYTLDGPALLLMSLEYETLQEAMAQAERHEIAIITNFAESAPGFIAPEGWPPH